MRREILKHLREGTYISGENIAKDLGITRTAVWKYIRNLRKEGYQISSSPRLGHRLEQAPDLLNPEEIQSGLTTHVFGRSMQYHTEVASTQHEARRLAESNAEEGTLVVAEAQSEGRGRRDRYWVSPPGMGIYLSLILRPDLEPLNIAQIPLVMGIGICESISQVTGLQPRIKWPNDVLLEGKKVAGILVEMSAEPERVHYIILGIGINVNTPASMFPDDLRSTATSIAEVAGHPVCRRTLVQRLLQNLESIYNEFKRVGFEDLMERWRLWDQTIHSRVEIADASGSFVGYALDIDKDGALIVKDQKDKIRRALAGDVTLTSELAR